MNQKPMKKNLLFLLAAVLFAPIRLTAQKVDPQAYFTNSDGKEEATRSIDEGQAPLEVTFRANPTGMDEFSPSYEWHFRKMKEGTAYDELFVRYEEDTQYTFNESGTFNVVLKTHLNDDAVADPDSVVIVIAVLQSRLEFPNAFSPNDDGINDKFMAKEGWRSIVEFHGYIFNRWGQKLFDWTDLNEGWDGKYKGKYVSDGVYYLLVKAKGADGHRYNIRKDINLLRGYTEGGQGGGTTGN